MKQNNNYKRRIFPQVWPWLGVNKQQISFKEVILSRRFTISYLIIIWSLVAILGFGSTRDCSSTWQLELQCNFSFWQNNFTQAPWLFFRNLFFFALIHNGVDHILFITLLGALGVFQAYEVIHGSHETLFMFLIANLLMGGFFGFFFHYGVQIAPTTEFFVFFHERGWMGGSIAMFFMLGAQIHDSRKPLTFLCVPIAWELFVFFILKIDHQITFMHETSILFGWGIKSLMNRFSLKF